MSLLAAAPVLLPLGTAALCALMAQRPRLQARLSLGAAFALVGLGVALVQQTAAGHTPSIAFGGWEPPYAIAFQIDRTSALLILVSAIMSAASLSFVSLGIDVARGPRPPMLLPLVHGLLAGVCGSFATADLFNLYVWFEVMLIAGLGLFATGGRKDHLEATLKYFVLNLFGTLLLLSGVGIIYAMTGHLNYGALRTSVAALPESSRILLVTLFSVGLLLKAGAVPLATWLPASYPSLSGPILALFAGLLTKVGAYALLRTFGGLFAPAPEVLQTALGWIACLTMVGGVFGAAYHYDLRRILSFHVISQIGYILLGIALGGAAGHAATLFYTVHHILVKANLFLLAALIATSLGSYDLRQIGGLAKARPLFSLLAIGPMLSLVGIPPFSGFWAKWLILSEAVAQGRLAWMVVALLVSGLTLYSMLKIVLQGFWKPHPEPTRILPPQRPHRVATAICGLLFLLTLFLSLMPEVTLSYCRAAARLAGDF